MIRPLRLAALAGLLAIAGTACWLEVPNLKSTGGGYPGEETPAAPVEPGAPETAPGPSQ